MLKKQILLFSSIVLLLNPIAHAGLVEREQTMPFLTFRKPRNIIFSTIGGGSSHHMWVFEILKEMDKRGHNVSFYSRDDQLRFTKDYPMINAKPIGGPIGWVTQFNFENLPAHAEQSVIPLIAIKLSMVNYTLDFEEYKQLFKSENPGLVICDSFAIPCLDAALYSKIPVIMTSTFGSYSDFNAPYIDSRSYRGYHATIETDSVWSRIYRNYIRIPLDLYRMARELNQQHAFQQEMGFEPSFDQFATRYNDIPKLINNVFGIEVPRPLSPFINMIGPVMRNSYPSIDSVTAAFLNSHSHIVYVAFGQYAAPSVDDIVLIMKTLLKLKEQKYIDGILWAGLRSDLVPEIISTTTRNYTREYLRNYNDLLMIDWAPQFAILQHPATSFFFSHGGAGSLHEALYNGVRLFVFPYFGDQPLNARTIFRAGLGRFMDAYNVKYDDKCYQQMYDTLREVAADPGGKIQATVDRYKAYMQISSVNAVQQGADLMEESLFASDENGKLTYRRDAGYDIHWFKRHNLDEYLVLFSVAVGTLKLFITACISISTESKASHKLKKQ